MAGDEMSLTPTEQIYPQLKKAGINMLAINIVRDFLPKDKKKAATHICRRIIQTSKTFRTKFPVSAEPEKAYTTRTPKQHVLKEKPEEKKICFE